MATLKNPANAMKIPLLLMLLLLTQAACINPVSAPQSSGPVATTDTAEPPLPAHTLWSVLEEEMRLDPGPLNPFTEIDLALRVEAPEGRTEGAEFSWFGFYDGDGSGGQSGDVWRFRLMLDTPGTWRVWAQFRRTEDGSPLAPEQSFTYEVSTEAAPSDRGHVRRDPGAPMRLAFADGTPWVPFSMHASFLLDQVPATARRWIDEHSQRGINSLSVRFHAEAKNAIGVVGHWHFLGIDGKPVEIWPAEANAEGFDYSRYDVSAWQHNVRIMEYAYQQGIRLYIWFGMSGDNRQYRSYGPQDWITDGELGPLQKRFIRYFLARWAPLPVWWHWTVDSEYEEGPGDDLARDRAWAAELQRLNPWPTLITTHVLRQWTPKDAPEYDLATLQLRVPADPERVVSDAATFIQQNLAYGIPVLNAEGVWSIPLVQTRLGMLASLMAGGYSHIAHQGTPHTLSSWGCEWETVIPRHREDATVIGAMSRFFNSPAAAGLNRTIPAHDRVELSDGRNALCLADPGRLYLVWLDEGGIATLDLSDAPGEFRVEVYAGPQLDAGVEPLSALRMEGGDKAVLPISPLRGFGNDTLYVIRALKPAPLTGAEAPVLYGAAASISSDTVAPVIEGLKVEREGDRLIVTWRTGEPASTRVQWGNRSEVYEADTAVTAEAVTGHRVAIPYEGGDQYIIAVSADPSGNTIISEEIVYSFE